MHLIKWPVRVKARQGYVGTVLVTFLVVELNCSLYAYASKTESNDLLDHFNYLYCMFSIFKVVLSPKIVISS